MSFYLVSDDGQSYGPMSRREAMRYMRAAEDRDADLAMIPAVEFEAPGFDLDEYAAMEFDAGDRAEVEV